MFFVFIFLVNLILIFMFRFLSLSLSLCLSLVLSLSRFLFFSVLLCFSCHVLSRSCLLFSFPGFSIPLDCSLLFFIVVPLVLEFSCALVVCFTSVTYLCSQICTCSFGHCTMLHVQHSERTNGNSKRCELCFRNEKKCVCARKCKMSQRCVRACVYVGQQLPTCVRSDCIVVQRSCLSCGANRERCGTAMLKTHTQVDNMELETEKLARNTCSRHHPGNVSVSLCAWPNSYDCNCMCADKNKRHQRCLRACVCVGMCVGLAVSVSPCVAASGNGLETDHVSVCWVCVLIRRIWCCMLVIFILGRLVLGGQLRMGLFASWGPFFSMFWLIEDSRFPGSVVWRGGLETIVDIFYVGRLLNEQCTPSENM